MRAKMTFHLFERVCKYNAEPIFDTIDLAFNIGHILFYHVAQIHMDQWEEEVYARKYFLHYT